MSRMLLSLFLLMGPLLGADAAEPAGPVAVTVVGNISKPNRGPFEPFADAFFKHHEEKFRAAAAFDRAALAKLGMKRLTVKYPTWPRAYTLEGPLLRDVLAAAGARGTKIVVNALDGYAAEIPIVETRKYPVVLAIKRDGRFLGLGGRGPAWIVYPRGDYPELRKQDDAKWVWSAYFIRVE